MKFYFDLNDTIKYETEFAIKETGTYWDEKQIRKIRLYEATAELDREFEEDETCPFWCVYDPWGNSSDAVEVKDENEAYDLLQAGLNFSLYEYYHDL